MHKSALVLSAVSSLRLCLPLASSLEAVFLEFLLQVRIKTRILRNVILVGDSVPLAKTTKGQIVCPKVDWRGPSLPRGNRVTTPVLVSAWDVTSRYCPVSRTEALAFP